MLNLTRRQLCLGGVALGLSEHKAMAQTVTQTAMSSVQLPDGHTRPCPRSRFVAPCTGPTSAFRGRRSSANRYLPGTDADRHGRDLWRRSSRADDCKGHCRAAGQGVSRLQGTAGPRHPQRDAAGLCREPCPPRDRLSRSLPLALANRCRGPRRGCERLLKISARRGRIRRWGVSNFDVRDMEDLYRIRGGDRCSTNQVRYNLQDRGIERESAAMVRAARVADHRAYSPLGQGGDLLRNPALARVAERHQSKPAAIALAWTMRSGRAISIPEAGSPAHVRENALGTILTPDRSGLKRIGAGLLDVNLIIFR